VAVGPNESGGVQAARTVLDPGTLGAARRGEAGSCPALRRTAGSGAAELGSGVPDNRRLPGERQAPELNPGEGSEVELEHQVYDPCRFRRRCDPGLGLKPSAMIASMTGVARSVAIGRVRPEGYVKLWNPS
jgi:hypothetical protein